MSRHITIIFSVLFFLISFLPFAEGGLWDNIPEIEFNQDDFTSKYQFNKRIYVAKEGTPNYVRWDKGKGSISYLTSKNPKNQYDIQEYQLWQISPLPLEAKLRATALPSRFVSNSREHVVFIQKGYLKIRNIKISNTPKYRLPDASVFSLIGWSPNDKEILLSSNSQSSCTIWLFEIGQKAFKEISQAGNPSPGCQYFTVWSPDGKKLFYPAYATNAPAFHVSLSDGSNKKVIQVPGRLGLGEPSWTHSDYILLYAYNIKEMIAHQGKPGMKDGDFSDIYVIDVKKNTFQKLFPRKRRSDSYPVLSPDGKHVVFYGTDRNGSMKLMLTDLRGSYCISVDDNVTPGQPPSWSGDSKQIAYDKLLSTGEIAIGIVSLSVRKR